MEANKRGPKPKNRKPPTPLKGIPDPPDFLCDVAADHWREFVPLIHEAGLLSLVDADALALYCDQHATWLRARDRVADEGEVITASNGYPMENPWSKIATAAMKELKSYLIQFGCTPNSRNKMVIEKPKAVDTSWEEAIGE